MMMGLTTTSKLPHVAPWTESERLMVGRTVIAIAHRHACSIVVMGDTGGIAFRYKLGIGGSGYGGGDGGAS